jgi:hypothetical protein
MFWLFVAATVLGLYVWVTPLHAPGHFLALEGHLYAGLLLIVASSPALGWHLRKTASRLVPSLLIPAAILAIIAVVMPGRPEYPAFGPIGWAAGTSSLQLLISAAFMKAMKHPGHSVKTSVSGVILAVVALFALHVGVMGWLLRGDERWGAMMAHSAVGIAVAVFVLPHLKLIRKLPRIVLVPTTAVVLLGLLIGWFRTYPHDLVLADFRSPLELGDFELIAPPDRFVNAPVLTLPADAEARSKAPSPTLDPNVLGDSASCGNAGCHEVLTKQWAGSAHRHAADNAFYRAAIRRFVQETSPENAIFCANCHDPVGVLAGTAAADYADGDPPPSDGVSCVVCHATVHVPEDPANGIFTVREPPNYPGSTPERIDANIKLDPRTHRQLLASNFRINDPNSSCATCHRVRLGPDLGLPENTLQDPVEGRIRERFELGCTDCHMPTLTTVRSFEQPQYDHYWSGINVDLARYATGPRDKDALELVRTHTEDWLAGRVETAPLDESLAYGIPEDTVAMYGESGVLAVSGVGTVDGGTLTLTITSRNHRAGHSFPVGPFDLQEVWQEVVVTDAAGSTVAHIGALLEDETVPPDAARLGAQEIGSDGHPIEMHRIWDVVKVRGKRQIEKGGQTEDEYSFALPEGAVGPFVVRAAWNFRRANPAFTRWAMGEDAELMPVHVLGSVELTVP